MKLQKPNAMLARLKDKNHQRLSEAKNETYVKAITVLWFAKRREENPNVSPFET